MIIEEITQPYLLTPKELSILTNKKGGSVIEIIVAVGIFTLIAASVVTLYLGAYDSTIRDTENIQADMYLQETMEAVRSIRDFSFANLTNGTHGLTRTNGYWELSGSSDTLGQFTRSVTIADVVRDANCAVTTSGTTDAQAKKITATISWDLDGNNQSIAAIEYIPKWDDQTGCKESSWLTVDTSAITLAAGNKQVEGVNVENVGAANITITSIVPTWESAANVTEFKMGDTRLWKSTGSYSPAGAQPSGVELDLVDYLLVPSGGSPEVNKIRFSESMEDIPFTLLFKMADGSGRYIEAFSPAATCPAQADSLTVDTSGASIGGGGNTQLLGITVQNSHAECEIRIDTYTLTWTNGEVIEKIRVDGSNVWVHNGAGSPDGKQPTGTVIDADDTILEVGAAATAINYFQFDGSMNGDTFDITFTLNDESTKTISNLSP